MSSEAAQKAYPDEYYDAGLGLGPQLNPWTGAYREGFDLGAVAALRRAAARVEGDSVYDPDNYGWVVDVIERMADEWEGGSE